MARIQIGGVGGAPSNNVIRSLCESLRKDYLIGASSLPSDLFLAQTDEKHVIPTAKSPRYKGAALSLRSSTRPDLIHHIWLRSIWLRELSQTQ